MVGIGTRRPLGKKSSLFSFRLRRKIKPQSCFGRNLARMSLCLILVNDKNLTKRHLEKYCWYHPTTIGIGKFYNATTSKCGINLCGHCQTVCSVPAMVPQWRSYEKEREQNATLSPPGKGLSLRKDVTRWHEQRWESGLACNKCLSISILLWWK